MLPINDSNSCSFCDAFSKYQILRASHALEILSIPLLVEIQDHCDCSVDFPSISNFVNVLLIFSALAMSLAPSAPISFLYFDTS